jgi:hypothetical protein
MIAAVLKALPALAILAASCGAPQVPAPSDPEKALAEGSLLTLPVDDPFPRLGLQWVYEASISGFQGAVAPPRIAYRLATAGEGEFSWEGWWITGRAMELTGASIEKDKVFFHPPRLFPFQGDVALTYLQVAPWPVATPGKTGKKTTKLVMDATWEAVTGLKEVVKTYEDVGMRPVEVPAGKFEEAWYVEGSSPGWKGQFWWVDRVGWARMLFAADDGRTVDLKLAEVRWVGPAQP